MKKIIFSLLFSVLILASCEGEDIKAPNEDVGENPETVYDENETEGTHYRYEYDSDGNQIAYKIETEYDSKGNAILELWLDDTGNVHRKCEMEYDGDGNNTVCSYFDDTDTIYRRFEYTYNSKGEKKTSRESNYEVGQLVTVTEIDENGNKTLDARYDEEGNELYRDESQYNAQGKTTLSAHYENGLLNYKNTYEYDADGKKLLELNFDGEGNETYREICKYDPTGNMLSRTQYKNEKLDTLYEYDEKNGKTTITKHNKDEEVKSVEVRETKDKERVNTFYDKDGNMTARYVYKYDDNGNTVYESYENAKKPNQNYEREHKYDSNGKLLETVDLLAK